MQLLTGQALHFLLAQCIQQHIADWNQTTLGLAVKLHHKHHGSSELIRTLNDHGITCSYDEVNRLGKSVVNMYWIRVPHKTWVECRDRFYIQLG